MFNIFFLFYVKIYHSEKKLIVHFPPVIIDNILSNQTMLFQFWLILKVQIVFDWFVYLL